MQAQSAVAEQHSAEQIAQTRTLELAVRRQMHNQVTQRARRLERELERAWRERHSLGPQQARVQL